MGYIDMKCPFAVPSAYSKEYTFYEALCKLNYGVKEAVEKAEKAIESAAGTVEFLPQAQAALAQVQTAVTEAARTIEIAERIEEVGFDIDRIYPVNSIYISISNANPGNIFGGTWQKIEGKFLFGTDALHPLLTAGGSISHEFATVGVVPGTSQIHPARTEEVDIMPPYIAVNIWVRAS